MKVILEEQARGSPAPGLPNHHLPQALFLLSDFSRVLRFAPTFWAAAAILCKLACGSAYLCSLLDQPRHWKEFGTPCVMSHSVTLLTIGSYQRGKNLSSSLLTLSTQLPPKYACTFSHVPQNTYESWRTKLDWPRLPPWMRRDQSVTFCFVCEVSLLTASRDCPVSTSNPSNLPTRTIVDYRWQLWLQTFVLSVWLFHRCSGANSCVHADTAGTICPWSHLLSPPSELF